MMLTIDLVAMPKLTTQVSDATCATSALQSKETSSGTVKRGTASPLMVTANTSAQSRTASLVWGENVEAFEGVDRIMLNDISRDNTQDKMRQYYKELNLQRQCERYEGRWWGRSYFPEMLEENEPLPPITQRQYSTVEKFLCTMRFFFHFTRIDYSYYYSFGDHDLIHARTCYVNSHRKVRPANFEESPFWQLISSENSTCVVGLCEVSSPKQQQRNTTRCCNN